MFTPEFILAERGEYVLIANHNLESTESIELSIKYNKARIAFAAQHLPHQLNQCRIIYDARGQSVSETAINKITAELSPICKIEFKI
ncbi:hypothetical protein [Aeromonas schubertii]|uniref:hypothetical protein n=1 Tax=Aeromonas schubertii TaxID=652 RepID=UPI00067ECC76|nr:hypothetical protein [Aeromonas schubertii]KUE79682.1 hypothetical protein ATO46_18380 [Aeromonas schubertii]